MDTRYTHIVVLTGAGISAESGVATFRGKDGLWQGHRMEEVATPEAFRLDPELVQQFYNQRRRQLIEEIIPNLAHQALVDFEQQFLQGGGRFLLVTQNVDDLHDRAGNRSLIHMHGELLKARFVDDDRVIECRHDLGGAEIRPHIVWFGEMPMEMERIYQALERCDLFVAIGTSGHVYPAAGFVEIANSVGAHTVEINLEASVTANRFKEQIIGVATETVPEYFADLLRSQAGSNS